MGSSIGTHHLAWNRYACKHRQLVGWCVPGLWSLLAKVRATERLLTTAWRCLLVVGSLLLHRSKLLKWRFLHLPNRAQPLARIGHQ